MKRISVSDSTPRTGGGGTAVRVGVHIAAGMGGKLNLAMHAGKNPSTAHVETS
jgi:hypothetical protein